MTIDEAIKHAEEEAEEQTRLYRLCPASESEFFYCDGTKDCRMLKSGKNIGCQKCAEEYRQLTDWLKDYKRLLEQEPILDKIKAEISAMMPPLGNWMYDEGHIVEQTACEVIADILQIIDKYRK